MKKVTTEEFIEKSNKIHNYKYDYSLTNYTGKDNKVIIICPIHGEFEQYASNHYKHGCNKCGHEKTSSTKISNSNNNFIEKANEIHNFKYDYSKVNYVNNKEKICIICPEHGEF